VGEYKDGRKCGQGRFTWTDGSVYEGEFYDNNINGRGIFIYKRKKQFIKFYNFMEFSKFLIK